LARGELTVTPVAPYQALIFDCDGTLADTLPAHYQAWARALRERGIELERSWYHAHCGVSAADFIELIDRRHGGGIDRAALDADRIALYRSLVPSIEEIAAVADVARAHAGRVPMAVASGGLRALVEATLTALGLLPVFDAVVTIEDVPHGKPAPDLFLHAAQRLGVPAAACVVYEDSDQGVQAARRAGMRVVDIREGAKARVASSA
jgi:beta-phosphoglucomutase-like phosphatase (HAD superfamily)